jgi:hypothetical protein
MPSYRTSRLASLVSRAPFRKGLVALRAIVDRGRVSRMSSWNMLPGIRVSDASMSKMVDGTSRGRG